MREFIDDFKPFALFIVAICIMFAGFFAFIIWYGVTVDAPKREAWLSSCAAKGGIALPTRVHHGPKTGTMYGDYICVEAKAIDINDNDSGTN